ncbi:type II secretion system protein [Francisella philomiragia]|uniref:type II secretion system protein n=1 Tax=Francisella philomiragia TaxID=28110 RepID=UPI0021C9896F|nr:type II secretion system protein [Francisella philomiragia]
MRRCKKNISVKNLKGFTFIEVLIASILGIFVLMAAFYAIGNILSNAVLTEKKVELANELESRVDNYMLTGSFDDSSSGDLTFSRVDSGSGIREFVGTNSSFSLQIIKRAYVPTTVAEIIDRELGPYMRRANEIYIEKNASVIDDPAVLADIEIARNQYLSDSTSKWSSSTAVLLNLGTTQIVTTVPLADAPLGSGAYITVAPFTNADITPAILWHCTAFGFDSDLLPSWCVL